MTLQGMVLLNLLTFMSKRMIFSFNLQKYVLFSYGGNWHEMYCRESRQDDQYRAWCRNYFCWNLFQVLVGRSRLDSTIDGSHTLVPCLYSIWILYLPIR